ncbi:MAG TPA: methionyl-tRNA formyltransferase [Polyangia bacterium]|jgi:methionyl-tRNA formyltransferase|nr:methionyl-tRNA formyltransferase [Polyangia bacterium]
MSERPRALFFGSPDFAVPGLQAVAALTDLRGVVSQPDRPAGRGRELHPPAVKLAARDLGVPVLQPEKIRTPELEAALRALDPEIFVVIAYGRILPPALLAIPPLGCWNVHASLLPRLRGAAPIQWAIIRGESRTGVAVMRMEEGLDTGPVAAVAETPISDDDTAATLSARLARAGAGLLADTLPRIITGTVTLREQEHALATLAPPLKKEDGRLDFAQPARAVSARARGVDPWPGAAALLDGEVIKLFAPRVVEVTASRDGGAAGRVLGAGPDGLIVGCGEGGAVAFGELQLPGRKRLPAGVVLNGRPIPPDTLLG